MAYGRAWLWAAPLGLAVAFLGWRATTRRRQGALLSAGALVVLGGVLGGGFAIAGQPGIGLGGALTLLASLLLLGAGTARLGWVRGDAFTASAIVCCVALLLLFVAFPVARALAGAFVDDTGRFSLVALAGRIATEPVWGLGCLAGGLRCGVAWNTLFLALLTATGTTLLGTMIALVAERGATRLKRPLNALALLPIITPPFVVGLGLILLFGRAGIVNQGLEGGVRHHAVALVLRPASACWLAQLFAFTPIAFMIVRGVVAGDRSLARGSGADAARRPAGTTFSTVTLPLLKPGLANAFLVGFIESIADFGNPIVVGGQFCGAFDRRLLRHRRRAVRPGTGGVAGADALSAFALVVFWAAAAAARPHRFHHRHGQGRRRPGDAAARRACAG